MIRFNEIQSECRVYRWRSIWANSIYPIPLAGKGLLWLDNCRCFTELERRFSPKETPNWLGQEAIFNQEQAPRNQTLVVKAHPDSNTPIIGFVAADTEKTVQVGTKSWRKHLPGLHLESRGDFIVILPFDGYLGV